MQTPKKKEKSEKIDKNQTSLIKLIKDLHETKKANNRKVTRKNMKKIYINTQCKNKTTHKQQNKSLNTIFKRLEALTYI
jgi:hypothetical protein